MLAGASGVAEVFLARGEVEIRRCVPDCQGRSGGRGQ